MKQGLCVEMKVSQRCPFTFASLFTSILLRLDPPIRAWSM
jgi:hypothetical protein